MRPKRVCKIAHEITRLVYKVSLPFHFFRDIFSVFGPELNVIQFSSSRFAIPLQPVNFFRFV